MGVGCYGCLFVVMVVMVCLLWLFVMVCLAQNVKPRGPGTAFVDFFLFSKLGCFNHSHGLFVVPSPVVDYFCHFFCWGLVVRSPFRQLLLCFD